MSYISSIANRVRKSHLAPTKQVWMQLADAWGLESDYTLQELAPEGVCPVCWGFNVCAECLGQYPGMCPGECKDGTCSRC